MQAWRRLVATLADYRRWFQYLGLFLAGTWDDSRGVFAQECLEGHCSPVALKWNGRVLLALWCEKDARISTRRKERTELEEQG